MTQEDLRMPTTTAPDLTLEDVAHFADASDELPEDTALRLQALICCDDQEQVQETTGVNLSSYMPQDREPKQFMDTE